MSETTATTPETTSSATTTSVVVAGARTPMGRLLGSLSGFSAA